MATCKDCLHYGICVFHLTGDENQKCPHYIADVVPKSQYDLAVAEREANVKGFTEEIERMNVEIQALRAAANSYKMHYENARSEVVSEVLQMIKNICAYEERLSYQTIEEGIKRQMALKASRTKADRCVVCGEIVPEGRQVCSMCQTGQEYLKKRKGEEFGEQENVFKTIN